MVIQNVNQIKHTAVKTDQIKNKEQIDETINQFEAVVLTQLLQEGFNSNNSGELNDSNQGSVIFKTLLLHEYAKNIAASDKLELGKNIKKQIIEGYGQNAKSKGDN